MNFGVYYGDLIGQKHKGTHPVSAIRSNLSIIGEETFTTLPEIYRAMADACTKKEDAASILKEYQKNLSQIPRDAANDTWTKALIDWSESPEEYKMPKFTAHALIQYAPVGLVAKDIFEAKRLAKELAQLQFGSSNSNNQYVAQLSAAVVYLLSTKYSKGEVHDYLCRKLNQRLPKSIVELRTGFNYSDDATTALIASIVSLYDSDSSLMAIKNSLTLGGNVSANCTLTAIIAELYYGLEHVVAERVHRLMTQDDFVSLNNLEKKSQVERYKNGKRMRQFVKIYFPESVWG